MGVGSLSGFRHPLYESPCQSVSRYSRRNLEWGLPERQQATRVGFRATGCYASLAKQAINSSAAISARSRCFCSQGPGRPISIPNIWLLGADEEGSLTRGHYTNV